MGTLLEQFKWQKGDLNGFIQLFFDNLATVLSLIFFLGLTLRGFGNEELAAWEYGSEYSEQMSQVTSHINEIIYQRAIPGLAITMVFGNVYYTWMGARLGRDEDRAGKVTALPYGVNTPGAFAFVFSIIGPTSAGAGAQCNGSMINSTETAQAFADCWMNAADAGWEAGVVSNFLAGIISVILGLLGKHVLKVSPVLALLTALSGIGFVFLGLNQVSQNFAEPVAGFLPLFLVIAGYFGEVSFGPLPKSLVVAVVGIALGWMDGVATPEAVKDSVDNVKAWGVSTGFSALGDWSSVGDYIGTTFPVALAAAAGTMMNVISAENAGDRYGVTETMISDGVGTIIGAIFGTPFGTSVYIGHPAYKKMGAGIIYSLINCVVFFFFGIFGIFALVSAIVPSLAVAPLIFFVGMMICQEAMASAPARQYPSFLLGLFPSLTDWAVVGGLDLAGVGGKNYYGFVSMSKGSLLLSLVLVSISFFTIERDFLPAAGWCLAGAFFSAFGFLHQDTAKLKDWTEPQTMYCSVEAVNNACPPDYMLCAPGFGPQMCAPESTLKWRYMTGYLMVGATMVIFHLCQRRGWVEAKVSDEVHEIEEETEMGKSTINGLLHQVEEEEEREKTTDKNKPTKQTLEEGNNGGNAIEMSQVAVE